MRLLGVHLVYFAPVGDDLLHKLDLGRFRWCNLYFFRRMRHRGSSQSLAVNPQPPLWFLGEEALASHLGQWREQRCAIDLRDIQIRVAQIELPEVEYARAENQQAPIVLG